MPKLKRSNGPALACPMCGFRVSFVLTTAIIESRDVVQTHAMQFKPASRAPKKFTFRIPLFLSCSQCGQPLAPPPVLLHQSHNRR